jgi:phosphoadenosine phosphosulfate reductase
MNNEVYENTLSILKEQCEKFKSEGSKVYATSSFQTQSIPLLHIIGKHFARDITIIFLDTGFLFAETYKFKEKLQELYSLKIKTVSSNISKHQQIDPESGLFQYSLNPDNCCYINKVEPLNNLWKNGDVWISGVRRDQSSIRKEMDIFERRDNNVLKFHPMLEWTNKDIYDYIKHFNLPKHPLENEGYMSIGCVPCTHKMGAEKQRGGRWLGSKKTECGLHINKK